MTSQTPIGSVWEPRLSPQALPNGMPLGSLMDDQTLYSDDTARVLLRRTDASAILGEDAWLPQPTKMMVGRKLVSLEKPSAVALPVRFVRYEVSPNGIVATMLVASDEEEARLVHGALAELKDALTVDWDQMVELLDMRRRTFFSHRKAGIFPVDRLADVRTRVGLLRALVAEDAAAARVLVATRAADIAECFRRLNYDGIRAAFGDVRRQLANVEWTSPEIAARAVANEVDDVASVASQPGFAAAASAYAALSSAGSYPHERFQSLVEVEQAVKAAHEGRDPEEQWEFLPTLRHVEIDAVRERARDVIGSVEFSPEAWKAFVETESESAWASYAPVVLPPDDVVPLPGSPADEPAWEPDISVFGIGAYLEPGS